MCVDTWKVVHIRGIKHGFDTIFAESGQHRYQVTLEVIKGYVAPILQYGDVTRTNVGSSIVEVCDYLTQK